MQNFLEFRSRQGSLMRRQKRFASNVHGIQAGLQIFAARDAKLVWRSRSKNFHRLRSVAGNRKGNLRTKRRQIVEANNGVLRKTFV